MNHHSVEFSAALGLEFVGRPALRIAARVSMQSGNPFLERIDGVIAMDGFDASGWPLPEADFSRSRALAAMQGKRQWTLAEDSAIASALAIAALRFAEFGTPTEADPELAAPVDPPVGKRPSGHERIAQFAAGLSQMPQDAAS